MRKGKLEFETSSYPLADKRAQALWDSGLRVSVRACTIHKTGRGWRVWSYGAR